VTADGRFAPSPTGTLHVGNLRTALVAWLFARSQDARYLVRMEDLDSGRVRERFYDEQLADLAALGLDWDGPVVRQSQRIALYEEALGALRAAGLVYECWCTRAEIREAASAPHGELPEGAYPGTCRRLSASQRAEREASGRPPALRVRADAARVGVDDRLAGPTTWPSWSTTPTRASARSCVVPTCSTPPRASCGSARGLGSRPRATPMWRSCSGPTASGWPSAMAP
jgi:glutamyl-tRNA synthetase